MYHLLFQHIIRVMILAAILSCNSFDPGHAKAGIQNTTPSKTSLHSETEARPVHWSYTEEGGPEGWAKLSPTYAQCGLGKLQSPVNLVTGNNQPGTRWKVEYKTTELKVSHNQHMEELIDNGHTIQVTLDKGSTITYGGKTYHLKQFHFHTPSEHTLDSIHAPMEIHLVHQSEDKSFAVIGVLVKKGNHNKHFDQLIKILPNSPGEKSTHESLEIDLGAYVPKDLHAYHYVGSLTTPPCTENVQWLVMKNLIEMSTEQIRAFSSRLKNNNRPAQPLNKRKITMDDIPTIN